jgi:hypothetical protein
MSLPLLILSVAGPSGCDRPSSSDAVARVAEWTFTTDRLAELLVLAQPFPLDSATVEGLARHWVGAAALAQRAALDDLTSEAATRAATWLEEQESLLELDREDRLGSSVVVDRLVSEIAFRVGDLRLFAHVLRRVGPETPPQERDLQQSTAQRILEELVAGGSWDAAVAESDDLDTREASGLLGLFARGELPPDLDRVGFGLQPGQVSSLVASVDGFHILYRPRFEDVAGLYASRLRSRELGEADAAGTAVLLARRGFNVSSGAARAIRRMAQDPWGALGSQQELGSWDDGTLNAASVARHVVALPDGARAEIAGAPDSELEELTRSVAVREIRVQDALSRGIRVDHAVLDALSDQHAEEVSHWRSVLEIEPGTPADPAAVDRYMDAVVARRTSPRPLSPLFEAWLLGGVDWEVRGESVVEAIRSAQRMIAGTG